MIQILSSQKFGDSDMYINAFAHSQQYEVARTHFDNACRLRTFPTLTPQARVTKYYTQKGGVNKIMGRSKRLARTSSRGHVVGAQQLCYVQLFVLAIMLYLYFSCV